MTHQDAEIFGRQGFGRKLSVARDIGVLFIDFAVAFVDPDQLGGGNVQEATNRSASLLACARQCDAPVAHSRVVFAGDGSDANIFSAKVPASLGLTEDAHGSQFVPALAPVSGELVVRKNVPSAFFGTNLNAWLTKQGIGTLLIAGLTTSGCVRATVVDAMSLGFVPLIVADCVGDRSLQQHQASLFDIDQKYGDVITLADAIALLKRQSNKIAALKGSSSVRR